MKSVTWKRDGRKQRWLSEEEYDGMPDFIIERHPGGYTYWLSVRTSAKGIACTSLADAQETAELIGALS